jgi:hypothetical protein
MGKDRQYEIVEETEFAFKQIQKLRQQCKEEDIKDIFTQLSFLMIEKSGDVSGRLYERIPDIKDNLNEIVKRLPDEIKVPQHKQPTIDYGLFGSSPISISPITKAVTQPENKNKVVDVIVDVIEGQKEKQRQKKKTSSVLNEISQANSHLHNVLSFLSDRNVSKSGVQEQLNGIEVSLKIIREWLNQND